jgi:hypothetical protein
VICGVARDLWIYDSGMVPRIFGFAICELFKKVCLPISGALAVALWTKKIHRNQLQKIPSIGFCGNHARTDYCCSKPDFKTRKLKYPILVMIYSALYSNVFVFVFKKDVEKIQRPVNCIRLLSIAKISGVACHW